MRCWRGPKSLKRGRRWAACTQHYAVTTTRILHLDGQGSRPFLPFHYNCRGQGHFYNLNLQQKMKIHQHPHLCLNFFFCTKAEISPLTFLFSTFYQPSESYTLICNGGGGWGGERGDGELTYTRFKGGRKNKICESMHSPFTRLCSPSKPTTTSSLTEVLVYD